MMLLSPTLKYYDIFKNPDTLCSGYDLVLLGYAVLRSPVPRKEEKIDNVIVPYQSMFFGTHFYYLTPQGAKQLLQDALPIDIQVDSYMGTELSRGKVIAGAHFPNLSWQRANDTDIQTPCKGCSNQNQRDRTRMYLLLGLIFIILIGIIIALILLGKKNHQ